MRRSSRSWSVITVKSRETARTPLSGVTAPVTRDVISLRSGQPAMVRAMSTSTSPFREMSTLRTIPRSTIERRSSGSSTGRSASMTCSVVTDGIGGSPFDGVQGGAGRCG